MNIYETINAVHKELAAIGISKDSRNNHSGYNFRGIDSVYNTVSPILAKHGLMILQRVLSCSTDKRANKSGGFLYFTVVDVELDMIALDGSKHTIKTFGEAMDTGDKSVNKALTAAYKYALFQAFCIPTESTDADSETHIVDHLMDAMQEIMTQNSLQDLTQAFKKLTKGHSKDSTYVQKLTQAAKNRKEEIQNGKA